MSKNASSTPAAPSVAPEKPMAEPKDPAETPKAIASATNLTELAPAPAASTPGDRVTSAWTILPMAGGSEIEARNNLTGRVYKGSIKGLNDILRG